ncbi:sulfite exporter TauE/SafE family protein [Paenibacillus sp.]|uniref:sulfite exporter TauE/SafE family protein n=1 Tax=Paenibacillus sp. TaxID=58172 RepID=UPI002D53C2F1|nr:sulfite exporter TauE/SafE family protein [Paenibacillus sp.]HZG55565.1 sulfite exporter TauE/SafE family protein [Paenibacillus sp.]
MEAYWFLFLVVALSSALQTGTGFGFSIMTVPLLLLVYGVHEAVLLNNAMSVLLSLLLWYRIRKEIDAGLLKRLLLGGFVAMPAGLLVFAMVPGQRLKLIVGAISILFTVLLALRFRMRQTAAKDRAAGGLSGFLAAAIGIPGPPLLAYASAVGMEKTTLRSTTLAFYLFLYSASFLLQLGLGRAESGWWISAALSVPAMLVGVLLGHLLFARLNQRFFHRVCIAILFATGVQLIYFGW